MKKSKATAVIILAFSLVLVLSGCSTIENMQEKMRGLLEESLIEKSGITDDENYQTYKQYEKEGKLDEDGKAAVDIYQLAGVHNGSIHITFADNANLKITFYYDAAHTEVVDPLNCRLNPGESLYYSEIKNTSKYADLYSFEEFKIVKYDEYGNRLDESNAVTFSDGKITINPQFTGTELGIEPVGKYEKKSLSLRAYLVDNNGNEIESYDGKWFINDKEYSGDEPIIEYGTKYTVCYKYDSEKYYVKSANPDIHSDSKGKVTFKERDASVGIGQFLIELHPYTDIEISDSSSKIVKVYNNKKEVAVNNKKIKLTKLKAGDTLSITVDKEYKLSSTFGMNNITDTDNGTIYEFVVPEKTSSLISLKVEPLAVKMIHFQVEENDSWEQFKNNYLSWLPWEEKEEEKNFIVIGNGTDSVNYSDLQNGKKLKLKEGEMLTITMDGSLLEDHMKVSVCIDKNNPIIIDKNFGKMELKYQYDEVSNIKIDLIEE